MYIYIYHRPEKFSNKNSKENTGKNTKKYKFCQSRKTQKNTQMCLGHPPPTVALLTSHPGTRRRCPAASPGVLRTPPAPGPSPGSAATSGRGQGRRAGKGRGRGAGPAGLGGGLGVWMLRARIQSQPCHLSQWLGLGKLGSPQRWGFAMYIDRRACMCTRTLPMHGAHTVFPRVSPISAPRPPICGLLWSWRTLLDPGRITRS